MAVRRPRCVCGDLYSEHDMRDQNTTITDPCQGPVCSALMDRRQDPCDDYHASADEYVPLKDVLPLFDLKQKDVKPYLKGRRRR